MQNLSDVLIGRSRYLNDEMKPSAQLRAHQEWAIEGDTDHPTWQVITGMQPAYLGSSDAFGTDQYPIGNHRHLSSPNPHNPHLILT